jgi:hypothetical protein
MQYICGAKEVVEMTREREIRDLFGSEKGQLFSRPLKVLLVTIMVSIPPLSQGVNEGFP